MSTDSGSQEARFFPAIIPVRAPLDLELTAGALRRLPQSVLYPFDQGAFRYVASLPSGSHVLSVRTVDDGRDGPALEIDALDGRALTGEDASAATTLIARMLSVERDLSPVRALLADDPILAPLANRLAGLKPPRFPTLWDAFCQIVPFQQVSLSAAVATLNRFVMAFGPVVAVEGRRYWGAPSPEQVAAAEIESLRACGLSAAKAQTLRALAERALEGELDAAELDGMSDEEAIAHLTRLPGIGRWSAQIALLRGLGRLSVFPSGDSGAARALRELFPDHAQPEAAGHALMERLGPWRGYLYFLLLGRRLLAQQAAAG